MLDEYPNYRELNEINKKYDEKSMVTTGTRKDSNLIKNGNFYSKDNSNNKSNRNKTQKNTVIKSKSRQKPIITNNKILNNDINCDTNKCIKSVGGKGRYKSINNLGNNNFKINYDDYYNDLAQSKEERITKCIKGNASSYTNIKKDYFYGTIDEPEEEGNNKNKTEKDKLNTLPLNSMKVYQKNSLSPNKNNNYQNVNGINYNNINIGINNNNFIIDRNSKVYQTYSGPFRSKPIKVNMIETNQNVLLDLNINKQSIKNKNKTNNNLLSYNNNNDYNNSNNKRSSKNEQKKVFHIETENDKNIKDKKLFEENENEDNNLNLDINNKNTEEQIDYFQYLNGNSLEGNSNNNIKNNTMSYKTQRFPSQSNIQSKNVYKMNNGENCTEPHSFSINKTNNNSCSKKIYKSKAENMNIKMAPSSESIYNNQGQITKNSKNVYIPTSSFNSQRYNKYNTNSYNKKSQILYTPKKNNFIKNETPNNIEINYNYNKKNVHNNNDKTSNLKTEQKEQKEYKIKLETIKSRVQNLLSVYSDLLQKSLSKNGIQQQQNN